MREKSLLEGRKSPKVIEIKYYLVPRPDRLFHGQRSGFGLAAGDGHPHQEVPSQPQRLEGSDLPAPAARPLCGVRHGPGLHQERRGPLSQDGTQPGALQVRRQLRLLQVSAAASLLRGRNELRFHHTQSEGCISNNFYVQVFPFKGVFVKSCPLRFKYCIYSVAFTLVCCQEKLFCFFLFNSAGLSC